MEPLNVALQANKLAPYIITLNPVLKWPRAYPTSFIEP